MGRAALHGVPTKLVIASRESRLAMWQAEHVRAQLLALYPSCGIQILGMTTRGDQILDRTLSKVGGKELFVMELEVAMAEGRADIGGRSVGHALPAFQSSELAQSLRGKASAADKGSPHAPAVAEAGLHGHRFQAHLAACQ